MLGLGWSEMLVLSVVVLIVVGPKDLPVMLRNIGRMMGSVRRMSNEFRREIDKAIALDEVKEAKKAISDPLRQTSDEIAREFNTLKNGKYQPSGKLKPSEPGKQSVAAEIRKQAGLPEPEQVASASPDAAPPPAKKATPAAAKKAAPAPRVQGKATTKSTTKAASRPRAPKAAAEPSSKSTNKPASSKAKSAAKKPAAKKAAAKVETGAGGTDR